MWTDQRQPGCWMSCETVIPPLVIISERTLVLWVPGGLERMFVELSRLQAGALRDPEARRSMATRLDSKPA